jgi:hypothetical protein
MSKVKAKSCTCPDCGSIVEKVLDRDAIRQILSESETLLKNYEEKELIIGPEEEQNKGVCWGCFYDSVEDFLAEYIEYGEQVRIRKEYNETWAPDFLGNLHEIMNTAMECSCLGCGQGTSSLLYENLNDGGKKIARKLLKEAGLRLKDVNRQVCICSSCIQEELEKLDEKKRKKLGSIERAAAQKAVEDLIKNVQKVNQDPQYKSKIIACATIGSFLSEKPSIPDIDIALVNTWKEAPEKAKDALEALKYRKELQDELNLLINDIVISDHIHFHSWPVIWQGKLRESQEHIPFKYEYCFIDPPHTADLLNEAINDRVQYVLENNKAIIID